MLDGAGGGVLARLEQEEVLVLAVLGWADLIFVFDEGFHSEDRGLPSFGRGWLLLAACIGFVLYLRVLMMSWL